MKKFNFRNKILFALMILQFVLLLVQIILFLFSDVGVSDIVDNLMWTTFNVLFWLNSKSKT